MATKTKTKDKGTANVAATLITAFAQDNKPLIPYQLYYHVTAGKQTLGEFLCPQLAYHTAKCAGVAGMKNVTVELKDAFEKLM